MKNTTVALLMALGLTLPAKTFGQDADPAQRPTVKRSTQRKMTVSAEAPPATPATRATPPATQAAPPASQPSTPDAPRQRSAAPPIAAVDVNHDGVPKPMKSPMLRVVAQIGQKQRRHLDQRRVASATRWSSTLDAFGGTETGATEPTHVPTRSRLGAVDINKDGVIDADEIGGASQVLAKLDKNGDGNITLDEVRSCPHQGAPTPRPSAGMPKE
jgi:hypothetical protein